MPSMSKMTACQNYFGEYSLYNAYELVHAANIRNICFLLPLLFLVPKSAFVKNIVGVCFANDKHARYSPLTVGTKTASY